MRCPGSCRTHPASLGGRDHWPGPPHALSAEGPWEAMLCKEHRISNRNSVCVCVCESLSGVQLCDPMDCGLPGCSVHGILQARILDWVAFSFSGDLPDPGVEGLLSCVGSRFFTAEPPRKSIITTASLLKPHLLSSRPEGHPSLLSMIPRL